MKKMLSCTFVYDCGEINVGRGHSIKRIFIMVKRFIKDVKKYYRYIFVSAKAELKAEVANSYLNWLWWILEPFCMMLIYTFIFGYVFNAREDYFPAFIFLGLAMWNFFSHTLTNSVKIVKNNKAVVSKVYIPKYVLILKKMCVNGFKMALSMLIVAGLMIVYRVPLSWNILYVIPLMLIQILFVFGFCTFFLHFGVFVEDLSNVVNIGLRLGLYLTGIMYSIESRVKGMAGYLLARLNPMAFFISSMRNAVLYGGTPSWKWMLAWTLFSLILIYIGVRLIYKNENSYVKVI